MNETWDEMVERHKKERVQAIDRLNEQGLTQTEAARELGCSLSHLNTYAKRYKIHWRVVKQGQRAKPVLVNGYQTSKELKAS